jgi:hypothetical protein
VERVERCRTTIEVGGGVVVVVRRGSGEDVVILAREDHGGGRSNEDVREDKAAAAEGAKLGSQDGPDRARIEERDLGTMVEVVKAGRSRPWKSVRLSDDSSRTMGVLSQGTNARWSIGK